MAPLAESNHALWTAGQGTPDHSQHLYDDEPSRWGVADWRSGWCPTPSPPGQEQRMLHDLGSLHDVATWSQRVLRDGTMAEYGPINL